MPIATLTASEAIESVKSNPNSRWPKRGTMNRLSPMAKPQFKAGFNLPLTRAISDAVSIPVIASGGVGTLDHLVEGVTKGGASAVLAASIFRFGDFTIALAKAHMAAAGIPMRLT